MFENILLGLGSIFQPSVLLFITLGTFTGLIIGALPGLTGNMAIALMVPLTFAMDPTTGLAFLAAIYCSAIFGGSISAILLGIPGTISSFATTLDGHPMAKQGRAGEALGISTLSSVFGGLFSAVVLMFFTPFLAEQALRFGPAEYFAVAVLGLSCIASIGGGSLNKGLLSGAIGLLISCIGMDPQSGYKRYTFGMMELLEGIELVPALIGFFGVLAVLKTAEKCKDISRFDTFPDVGSVWIGWKAIARLLPTWIRGAILGTVVGIIPGTGTNVATFMSYDLEKKTSKNPEKFGTGEPRGVAAPEAANNAVTGGSMVPLLALGVPGNATSALFLGAIMIHGMRTGPVFFTEHPDVIYGLFIAFFLANLIMAPLGLFILRYMKTILSVPENLLSSIILAFCVTGVYSLGSNPFDVLVLIFTGILGYACYKVNLPTAPMIVAMVLGPLTERNLRQALVANKGSWSFLWDRPLTLVILLISFASFFVPMLLNYLKARRAQKKAAQAQ